MTQSSASVSRPRLSFRVALGISVFIAALGFWVGPGRWLVFAGPNDVPDVETLDRCTWVAMIWTIFFFYCAFLFRRKALWFLLFAPFAAFWPTMFWLQA